MNNRNTNGTNRIFCHLLLACFLKGSPILHTELLLYTHDCNLVSPREVEGKKENESLRELTVDATLTIAFAGICGEGVNPHPQQGEY